MSIIRQHSENECENCNDCSTKIRFFWKKIYQLIIGKCETLRYVIDKQWKIVFKLTNVQSTIKNNIVLLYIRYFKKLMI